MEQAEQAPDEEGLKDDLLSIFQKICAALEPARTYSVSLHDEQGEPEWLSQGTLGPDEHQIALDALTLF